jgi:UDP-glucose 4-epimerase
MKSDARVDVIGTRHGEKLYETLLTREEMAVAEDVGGYYRVASDKRDLNYAAYFSEGDAKVAGAEDYNSHNTQRLDVKGMIDLLLELDIVQRAMRGEKIEV